MKKNLIALILLFLLCGCAQNGENVVNTSANVTSSSEIQSNREIQKSEKVINDTLNKYEECLYDFNGDGKEEDILLLTNAEKYKDGEYMWDDSNHWQLAVEASDGVYVLYDNYLHGNLKMNVSEFYNEDGSTVPVIRLSISTGASFEIREYRFVEGSVVETVPYNTGYINELSIEKY